MTLAEFQASDKLVIIEKTQLTQVQDDWVLDNDAGLNLLRKKRTFTGEVRYL